MPAQNARYSGYSNAGGKDRINPERALFNDTPTFPIWPFNTDLRKVLCVIRRFESITNQITEYSGFYPTSCET